MAEREGSCGLSIDSHHSQFSKILKMGSDHSQAKSENAGDGWWWRLMVEEESELLKVKSLDREGGGGIIEIKLA